MTLPVDVESLNAQELYELEYTLRRILDRDKSPPGLELALALRRQIACRARRVMDAADTSGKRT